MQPCTHAFATRKGMGVCHIFKFSEGHARCRDAGGVATRPRPTSAEELSRAMVTPPVAERRAADREGSVGLTPPFTPFMDGPTCRCTLKPVKTPPLMCPSDIC